MDEFNETLEQLELLIGKENAQKVVAFFEGMNIYFPKRIGLNELHARIYAELCRGATYQEVAVKYGYTKSYIRKIEGREQEKRRQARRNGNPLPPVIIEPEKAVKLKPRDTKPENQNLQGELFDYER
jgi:DNA-binding response OmpR family regulator